MLSHSFHLYRDPPTWKKYPGVMENQHSRTVPYPTHVEPISCRGKVPVETPLSDAMRRSTSTGAPCVLGWALTLRSTCTQKLEFPSSTLEVSASVSLLESWKFLTDSWFPKMSVPSLKRKIALALPYFCTIKYAEWGEKRLLNWNAEKLAVTWFPALT